DVLRDAGYSATSANSGAEALAAVESEEPDLVISDLRMSQMDGHQLQAELKRRLPNLTVIMITAFGPIANAVESLKPGPLGYQAVWQRRVPAGRIARPGKPRFTPRGKAPARRTRAQLRHFQYRRGQPPHGRGTEDDSAGGRPARYRPAPGRERHRQGIARAPA